MSVTPAQLRSGYGPIYRYLSRCGDSLAPASKLVLEDVAAPAAPVDPWEAEKAKWLGGSLGHVVRWKTSSAAEAGDA